MRSMWIRLDWRKCQSLDWCVLDKSGTDIARCGRKVANRMNDAGAVRSLVNDIGLQLECARALHEALLVLVLSHDNEKKIWRENERSRIRALQMDSLRGLSGIRRMDRVSNAQIRELWVVTKGVDERIDESVPRWFGHLERAGNDENVKRIYVGEYLGSHLVGRPRKRWIDLVNDCLKKRYKCWAGNENGA